MKVTVDLSGLDEFVEEVDENATELMKEAAHNAVNTQKERNVSNKKPIRITHGTCVTLPEQPLFVMERLSICMFRQMGDIQKRKERRKIF